MNRIFPFYRLIFALVLCTGGHNRIYAQFGEKDILEYRQKQISEITGTAESPLWPEDSMQLSYFPINAAYAVEARVEVLKGEKPFKMPTYAGTTKEFVRFARLHFSIHGKQLSLTAYRNLDLPAAMQSLNNILFVPFMDETNGEESYGGGRYLDIPIPRGTDSLLLDFNKAYNPYCAYSSGYRCPVPPQENRLSIRITAGEKLYEGPKRVRGERP